MVWELGQLAVGQSGQVMALVRGWLEAANVFTAWLEPVDKQQWRECDLLDNTGEGQVYPLTMDFRNTLLSLKPVWSELRGLDWEIQYQLKYRYNNFNPARPRAHALAIYDRFWPELEWNSDDFVTSPRMTFYAHESGALVWENPAQVAVGDAGFVKFRGLTTEPLAIGGTFRAEATIGFNVAGVDDRFTEYAPLTTSVPLAPPYFTEPAGGAIAHICYSQQPLKGLAQPGTTISYFIGGWKQDLAVPVGDDGRFKIPMTINVGRDWNRSPGIQAIAYQATPTETLYSDYSQWLTLWVDPNIGWDPLRSTWHGTVKDGPLAGQYLTYSFRDAKGAYSTNGWQIPGTYGFWDTRLSLYTCRCLILDDVDRKVTVIADGTTYGPYTVPGGEGRLDIDIATAHREVSIQTVCVDAETGEPVGEPTEDFGDVLIDPDGFVFDIDQGGDYSGAGGMFNPVQAISGVTVTAYVSAPLHGGWIPWPAHVYSQTNPQVTDATYPDGITTTGYFAFYTPPGQYYLEVQGLPGYQSWRSPAITVTNQIVHVNVPYTPWTGDDAPYSVTVRTDILTPTVLTIPVGSTVEWRSEITAATPFSDYVQLTENPALRVQSARDPLADTRAFDAGYLEPGRVYRRQFNWPGVYPYTDGAGHSGVIVVEGAAPPLTVDLGGPATGYVGEPLTFSAAVAPPTATLPITYTWQATGQTPQVHRRFALTDTATFTWTSAGPRAITVTVQNPYTTVTVSQEVLITSAPPPCNPPASVQIAGPVTMTVGVPTTFTATVTPLTETTSLPFTFPLTYTWRATNNELR